MHKLVQFLGRMQRVNIFKILAHLFNKDMCLALPKQNF